MIVGLMEGAVVGGAFGGATGIMIVNKTAAAAEPGIAEWILSSSTIGGATGGAAVGAWHGLDINWNSIGPREKNSKEL